MLGRRFRELGALWLSRVGPFVPSMSCDAAGHDVDDRKIQWEIKPGSEGSFRGRMWALWNLDRTLSVVLILACCRVNKTSLFSVMFLSCSEWVCLELRRSDGF